MSAPDLRAADGLPVFAVPAGLFLVATLKILVKWAGRSGLV
jgi:hypothetical protein